MRKAAGALYHCVDLEDQDMRRTEHTGAGNCLRLNQNHIFAFQALEFTVIKTRGDNIEKK